MSKPKFVPMTGLDNLTESERHEYYLNACEYFKLPADQNLLEFIWLDDGGRGKHLVLYAKRGATEIMRATHGISVDEMTQSIAPDFVMFTAKAHDKTGRTDVAVGSASIKGLSGKSLDAAIMTAQTRASRRVTLQLVGGGLLDESEVPVQETKKVEPTVPLNNVAPSPIVVANDAPGKDITEQSKLGMLCDHANEVPHICTCKCEKCKTNPLCRSVQSTPAPTLQTEPQPAVIPVAVPVAQVEEPKRKRKRRTVSLDQETPLDSTEKLLVAHPASDEPTPAQLAARAALEKVPPVVEESAEEREIREAEERLAALKAKKAAAPAPAPEVPPVKTVTLPSEDIAPTLVQATEPPPPAPPAPKNLPKAEQATEFKAKLFSYTNDVLRKGGMKGSEGIGGVEYKMRAFIRKMFPQTVDTKNLTADQWKALFGYLDEKLGELGAEGLVRLINEKIGAKE